MKENKLIFKQNLDLLDDYTVIIVDEQRGFYHPQGNLYVKGGEDAVKNTVALIESPLNIKRVIPTMDFHLYESNSYKESNIEWPWHCMAYSEDAGIANDVVIACAKKNIPMDFFIKGNCTPHTEYGAFEKIGTYSYEDGHMDIVTNNRMNNSPVHITTSNVIICGIAGDYCVKETIKNLLKHWRFNISVLMDGVASIDGGTALNELIEEKNLKKI
jgi:nicotinamidase-related amidase